MVSIVLVAIFGLIWGSFLNVWIYRIPIQRLSIHSPYWSFCPCCQETIRFYDNIPVLSYLLLGGKCRHCQASIPVLYPAVEISTALIFVFLVSQYANPLDQIQIIDLIRALMLATILIPIAVIDVQKYIVPNQLLITGLIFALGLNLAESIIHQSFFVFSRYLLWGVVAGVGLQTIAVIGKLALGRTAMGFGDVKLSVVIGLFLGQWQSLILVLVGAATCGAIVGTVALTWRRGEDRSRIPFAPFLSLATMVDLIWHQQIWNAYLHLISWSV